MPWITWVHGFHGGQYWLGWLIGWLAGGHSSDSMQSMDSLGPTPTPGLTKLLAQAQSVGWMYPNSPRQDLPFSVEMLASLSDDTDPDTETWPDKAPCSSPIRWLASMPGQIEVRKLGQNRWLVQDVPGLLPLHGLHGFHGLLGVHGVFSWISWTS